MTSPTLITAHDLHRYYRVQKNALSAGRFGIRMLRREMDVVKAIDGVNFEIGTGTAVALVGLNGAGKSTLLKLITGVLVPTSGELTVAGLRPTDQRTKVAGMVGVVFGHRSQLWWDVPLIESMKVLRRIYSVERPVYEERLEKLTALLDLTELLSRAPRQMSLGQRVRGEIMASLLHGPRLLILDEPTVGLDIIAKANIRRLIRTLVSEEQVTVILASHEVIDIEEICDRVMLIHHGKILYEGTLDALKAHTDVDRSLVLDVVRDGDESGTVKVEKVTVPLDGAGSAQKLIEAASKGTVAGATVTGGSLEQILAKIFGETRSG
ncbi:MAG: ATP-binding cassette domain-containing protein [Chloroflexi bacterium]|nr:ATP-binding cassette domain-containing protein [Chloroflexota bacterium]